MILKTVVASPFSRGGTFRSMARAVTSVLILAVCQSSAPAEAASIKDDPNGFNGYVWGTPLSRYPSLTLLRDMGSTDFVANVGLYKKPGEVLTLNNVPLSEIHYRFVDQQLESIELRYKGRENRDKLMRWVEERYGNVSLHERKMVNSVQWFGDQTTVTLSYDAVQQQGTLWFISRILNNIYNEFHQATQGD
jgi:hypothetical protein